MNCVTLLVSNLLTGGSDSGQPECEDCVVDEVRGLIKLMDEASEVIPENWTGD